MHVDKRIPPAAGLGGGSADAAAVLRWAGVDDLGVAAALGADVPFCLVGGRARVTGIGEILEPLPLGGPDVHAGDPAVRRARRAAVYRAWDELGGPRGDGPNDLEPAALAVEPRLAEWRDRIGEATGRAPTLAGSGSTWFVEGAFDRLDDALGAGDLPGDAHRPPAEGRPARRSRVAAAIGYLLRRWKRVRLSIFLCFFLRMRLRRFLISEPMKGGRLDGRRARCEPPLGRPAARHR